MARRRDGQALARDLKLSLKDMEIRKRNHCLHTKGTCNKRKRDRHSAGSREFESAHEVKGAAGGILKADLSGDAAWYVARERLDVVCVWVRGGGGGV